MRVLTVRQHRNSQGAQRVFAFSIAYPLGVFAPLFSGKGSNSGSSPIITPVAWAAPRIGSDRVPIAPCLD